MRGGAVQVQRQRMDRRRCSQCGLDVTRVPLRNELNASGDGSPRGEVVCVLAC